jgi:hypothetical protein
VTLKKIRKEYVKSIATMGRDENQTAVFHWPCLTAYTKERIILCIHICFCIKNNRRIASITLYFFMCMDEYE